MRTVAAKAQDRSVALPAMNTGPREESTRSRILDVAERLVQVRGFNGFSYADVAAELGVTKASLHYHFPGKAELGEALMVRYAERFAEALSAIDVDIAAAPAKLDAYAGLYADVLRERQDVPVRDARGRVRDPRGADPRCGRSPSLTTARSGLSACLNGAARMQACGSADRLGIRRGASSAALRGPCSWRDLMARSSASRQQRPSCLRVSPSASSKDKAMALAEVQSAEMAMPTRR